MTGRDPDVDANWISRLERGIISWPSADYRAALCAVYGVDDEVQLGLFPGARPGAPDAAVRKSADAKILDTDGDAELSSRIARHAGVSNVNALVLEQFDADVSRLARDFVSRPLAVLVPEIRALREEVFRLIEGRQSPSQSRRLYTIAGWLGGLAAHVSLDLGHQRSAATHVRTVLQCAEAAEHAGQRAWGRSFQSLAAYWSGDFQRAAALARDGYDSSPHSGTIRARLLSLEARALGAGGDSRMALRVLALAHDARISADADELPGVFAFPEAKQWTYTGTTLLGLGVAAHTHRAITASERAVQIYRSGTDEDRSPGDVNAAHLDLATAYLMIGEIEGVAAQLASVLTSPQRTASISIRLRNLDARLAAGPYRGSRAVDELREGIREAMSRQAVPGDPMAR